MNKISQKTVKTYLEYKNSSLYWIKKTSNRTKIGSEFGTPHSAGYRAGSILGTRMYLHKLIYIYHYGDIPDKYEIDHIDLNKSNNDIKNLRAITKTKNIWNSNYKSYYYCKKTKKYAVRIMVNGKSIWLGRHDSEEKAAEIARKFKEKHQRI